jgi:hypothetical protein
MLPIAGEFEPTLQRRIGGQEDRDLAVVNPIRRSRQ